MPNELKRTVLLIEDDLHLQKIFTSFLERANYTVIARGDADSGLRWLEQILPDLIILDMMLPGISGMEMLKLIRETENGQDVPVIVATANAELHIDDFAAYDIKRLMRKPFLPSEIVEAVVEVFGE